MATLYLRCPADTDDEVSSADAAIDGDLTTAWSTSEFQRPGQAIIVDRGDYQGFGRYEDMIDDDATSAWSTGVPMTPGQAVIIDRGEPEPGWGDLSSVVTGNTDGFWSTGTDMVPGQAIIIDRGTDAPNHQFSQIILDAGTTFIEDYPRSFSVLVSNDGVHWTSVDEVIGNAREVVSQRFPPYNNRYLKIEQTGTASHWWTVVRLRLINYVNFQLVDLDGDDWEITAVGAMAPPRFDRLRINTPIGQDGYTRAFTVDTSPDAATWTTIYTRPDPGVAAGPSSEVILSTFSTARYVRLTQHSFNLKPWVVSDLRLLYLHPSSAGTDQTLTLDRSAWILGVAGDTATLPWFDEVLLRAPAGADTYPRAFTIAVSDDGAAWRGVGNAIGLSPNVSYASTVMLTARFLKIELTAAAPYRWEIAELKLRVNELDQTLDPRQWSVIVPGMPVRHAEDFWQPLAIDCVPVREVASPAVMIDGDLRTAWSMDTVPHIGARGFWYYTKMYVAVRMGIIIDRGSDHTEFDTITIQTGATPIDQFLLAVQVYVSDDALVWTWIGSQSFVQAPAEERWENAHSLRLAVPAQTARFIQVRNPLDRSFNTYETDAYHFAGAPPSWRIADIGVFAGSARLATAGWTVHTPFRGFEHANAGLLSLRGPFAITSWVYQSWPDQASWGQWQPIKPLQLKMPNKQWRDVAYLGNWPSLDEPIYHLKTRTHAVITEIFGVHPPAVTDTIIAAASDIDYLWPALKDSAYQYMLVAGVEAHTIWYGPLPAVDQPQTMTVYGSSYQHSTVIVDIPETWPVAYQGTQPPATGYRFVFQAQYLEAWHDYYKPSAATPIDIRGFNLYYHEVPPEDGLASPGSGVLIHTFNTFGGNFIDTERYRASPAAWNEFFNTRGEMWYFEVPIFNHAVAFSLVSEYTLDGSTVLVDDPGELDELQVDFGRLFQANLALHVKMSVEVITG